jgi:hypothetical protein
MGFLEDICCFFYSPTLPDVAPALLLKSPLVWDMAKWRLVVCYRRFVRFYASTFIVAEEYTTTIKMKAANSFEIGKNLPVNTTSHLHPPTCPHTRTAIWFCNRGKLWYSKFFSKLHTKMCVLPWIWRHEVIPKRRHVTPQDTEIVSNVT